MSGQVSTPFPTSMTVVTLEKEMEKIQKGLEDLLPKKAETLEEPKEKPQDRKPRPKDSKEKAEDQTKRPGEQNPGAILLLVGEAGTGKTRMARKIVDKAVKGGLPFSGGLWFNLQKDYDDESFLLEVAYQLSLLSSRRVFSEGSSSKQEEKRGTKKNEEERKKEQEQKELFWASEVWEDQDDKEEEEEEEEEEEAAGKNKQEMTSEMNKQAMTSEHSAGGTTKNTADGEQGGEEKEEVEDHKSKKEEMERKKKDDEKKKKEEDKKKKEEERVKKLKLKVLALLSMKKYLLVLDGWRSGKSTAEDIETELRPRFKQIMSKLEIYIRETKTQFPVIFITVSCDNWPDESKSSVHSEIEVIDSRNSSAETIAAGVGPEPEGVVSPVGEGSNTSGRGAPAKWDESNINFTPIRINKLEKEECKSFFQKKSKLPSDHPRLGDLSTAIFNSSKGLPAAVLLVAKTLRHISEKEHRVREGQIAKEGYGEWTLDRAMDKVITAEADKDLFHCGYDMLPSAELVNCCWYSRELFQQHGPVHYNELISYWTMEGFLGTADCIRKTYNKGYSILTELIKRGMFVKREDNFLTMEEKALSVIDDRGHDITCTSSLGLPILFPKKAPADEGSSLNLGRIALADGMLKTPCHHTATRLVSTLLMDQNKLCREVPEELFVRMKGLQILVLLKPILEKLPLSLYKLEKLQILVLRDCELLKDVEGISDVRTLKVLEISGAGSLEKIPDALFEKLTQLICLNLSGSSIKELPSPSENPQDKPPILRWLILRGCPDLEELPSLSNFKSLEVIDLCGSESFTRIKDNFFTSLTNLQTVNFSGTKIRAFPIVGTLEKLTRLLFRNCKELRRIPRLPSGTCHLDLSGCAQFLELRDESLETKLMLKFIDASKTDIRALPSISMPDKLAHLRLSHFITDLEELSSKKFVQSHLSEKTDVKTHLSEKTVVKTLEYLDVSEPKKPADINSEIFGSLKVIQVLNLSGTKVTSLQCPADYSRLHQLWLSGCEHLSELPDMDGLIRLEVLDLSRCVSLGTEQLGLKKLTRLQYLNLSAAWKEEKFDASTILGQITSLQKLDLSGNDKINEVLNISNLKSLHELSLKDCKGVTDLASISELEKLQVLDLSGTALGSVPPIHPSAKSTLRVLDLSGTQVDIFPYKEISGFTVLQRLNLPNLENIDWKEVSKVRLPEELIFDAYGIFTVGESQGNNTDPTSASDSPLKVAVRSIKQQSEEEFINCYDQELISVSRALKYSVPGLEYKPVEARGIDAFPDACTSFLGCAQYLSVVDTSSGSLSELGSNIMKDVKRCWLDRCPKMKTIIAASDEAHKVAESLELLSLSNLPELENVCSKSVAHECFQNLTSFHLDCCPKLIHVFSLSHVPEKLEVLEIRFCDNLKTIFTSDGSDHLDLKLKLTKLRLFALPELESAGVKMPRPTNLDDKNGCPKWRPVWEDD